MKAEINQVLDYSFVDGVGNRSVIFFQGCNFDCMFCHNPETINHCNNCGLCVKHCPTDALNIIEKKVIWNKKKCIDCGKCYKKCPYSATPRIEEYTVDELIQRISKNFPFIRGITVSGGECTLYRDFLVAFFKRIKQENLSTLIDSNGSYPLFSDDELMNVTDGVMLDVKTTDSFIHKIMIKSENNIVLENLVKLAEINKLSEIRTVIFDGDDRSDKTVNDVCRLLNFVKNKDNITYKLIKYRDVGVRKKEGKNLNTPTDDKMIYLKNILEEKGFKKILIV